MDPRPEDKNLTLPKRKRIRFRNLSVQLGLIAIGIPTLLLLLFGVYRVHTQTRILEKQLDTGLKNEAVQLSASLSTALFNFDDATCRVICEAALKKPEIIKITIWDLSQEYLSFSDPDLDRHTAKMAYKTLELPIHFDGQYIGKVEIIATPVFLKQAISRLKTTIFWQAVILDLTLGLVLLLVLNIRFVMPLQDLQHSSERIARGQLDYPINIHRNDELGDLANNLVIMRDAVKEKVESLVSEIERHRKTSLALEKSESFLRLIIDLIPHMIFVKDVNGRFLVVNQAMADEMGLDVEQLTGKLHAEVIQDPAIAEKQSRDDRKVIERGITLSLLTETRAAASRRSRWFSTKKIPFTAADGDKGVVGITIDITEVKQAEEELKKTKKYIDNIINSMPSALFSLDRELNIILWNHKAGEFFNISAKEAVHRPLTEVVPAFSPLVDHILETVRTGRPYYAPKHTDQVGDSAVFRDITVYPLMDEAIEGAVIRVDDITEHVRMEEMVVQSEKMLSIGGLAAGMAHEINNPLAGMMQNAQVVIRRIRRDIPASVETARQVGITMQQIREFMDKRGIIHQLNLIHEAGIRASKIVQNMLSFSRKDYSGKTLQDISILLDQTIELAKSDYDLKRQYDFKKIHIYRAYDPDTPKVRCEVSKIQQVFFNILKNSAEAMHEIERLNDPAFHMSIRPQGRFVRIEIKDNGPGMPHEVRKRIFEPFFTTKPVGKGTGLGLSVSYFIVTDNHKGRMSVVSQPGSGAAFIIHLPVT